MRNLRRFILSVGAVITACGTITSFADTQPKVDQQMMPMLLIQYGFYSAYSGSYSNATSSSAPKSPLNAINQKLEVALNGLNADVPLSLSFARKALIVQPELIGNRYNGVKGVSVLYVMVPLNNLNGRVVAIVSSVGPERTTIFDVDKDLGVELVYDSMKKNQFSGSKKCDPLGQITSVQVSSASVLKLEESSLHWAADHNRQFTLDLSGGTPALICQ